jgi:hypothetical protein
MSSKSFWPLICSLFFLTTLMACGGGVSGPSVPVTPNVKPEFAYAIGNFGVLPSTTSILLAFKLDPSTGVLTQTANITLTGLAAGFVVDPKSRFIFITRLDLNGNVIESYSIDPVTGIPSAAGGFTANPGCLPPCAQSVNGPGPLAEDSNGEFLFYGSNILSTPTEGVGSLAVGNTGALSVVPGSPFPAVLVPTQIAAHPSGQFVYTMNLDPAAAPGDLSAKNIAGWSVGTDGSLTAITNSPWLLPTDNHFEQFLFHPSGKFLYGNSPLGTTTGIYGWNIDTTTGELTAFPNAPFGAGNQFGLGVFHPNGKLLYFSLVRPLTGITAFSVDSTTGTLTQLSNAPFAQVFHFSTRPLTRQDNS